MFDKSGPVTSLKGRSAIGHVRYSTTGGSLKRNVQPFFADVAGGGIAIAHNGNLTNARTLREELQARGSIFYATSDTEVIVHLVATSRKGDIVERLIDALSQVEGAYSLVALTQKKLIGARDPLGVRPLVIGQVGDHYVLASETCALDIIGARFVRDVEPGEMVVITVDGLKSVKRFLPQRQRFCIFEYVYFARPDSVIEGMNVYDARRRIGMELAREAPVDADIVVAVPDSGNPAAIGYANASGLPFEMGIIRNHYVGRTFIQPTAEIRDLGVKMKHNANRPVLEGKRVVLVDDSIVRGTTSQRIVQLVRDGGAKEVHMRIASPPTTSPCFLRRRHARQGQAARRPSRSRRRGHARLHQMRQPRVRLPRRALPRGRRAGPQRRRAAILRRLLQRPVSDASDRQRDGPRRDAALAADREGLSVRAAARSGRRPESDFMRPLACHPI